MRSVLLLATTLLLMSCNRRQQAEGQTGVEDEPLNVVTAQGNDVTAIDAATGEAANMAADVDFMSNELNSADNSDAPVANEG